MSEVEPHVDRSAFSVARLDDDHDDAEYWLTKSPEERLQALELMRRIQYGERATARLQRVLTVAHLKDLGRRRADGVIGQRAVSAIQ